MFNIERINNHSVMEYLHLKGIAPKKIAEDMRNTLQNRYPSSATVKNWMSDFKRGRMSVEDAPRSGRPVTVATVETVTAVHDTIMQDPRTTSQHIKATFEFSHGRTHDFIVDVFGMRKLPKDLNEDQRRECVQCCEEIVRQFEADEDGFLSKYVTMNETLVHHFDPETKQQSQQWKHPSSLTPKKIRVQK